MERMCGSLEIKALSDREFEGYGSTFKNVDHGNDIVLPGAFKRSLIGHKKTGHFPPMLWMHKNDQVPGKWLDMREDDHGLVVKGVLAPTPLGDEMHVLLKMAAVRGLSIGYETVERDFDADGNRLLKTIELWETSIVSIPMNPMANVVHVKSRLSEVGEYVPTVKEFESILRNAGCSRKVASMIAYRVRSLEAEGAEEGSSDEPLVQPAGDDEISRAQEIADKIMADCIKRRFAA